MSRFFWVLLCCFLVGASGCAAPGAGTAETSPPEAAAPPPPPPAPVAAAFEDVLKDGVYNHNGFPITRGWNRIPWSASRDEFKAAFPKSSPVDDEKSVWETGLGPEEFFGFPVSALYMFNVKGRFAAVYLNSDNQEMARALLNAMLNELGVPEKKLPLAWEYGSVVIQPVNQGVVIRGIPVD